MMIAVTNNAGEVVFQCNLVEDYNSLKGDAAKAFLRDLRVLIQEERDKENVQQARKEACVRCGALGKTPSGMLSLSNKGLCDSCIEREELVRVRAEEDLRSGDFDYLMNH